MERQVIHITSLFELGFTSTIFIFQNEKPHFRLLKTGFIDNLSAGRLACAFLAPKMFHGFLRRKIYINTSQAFHRRRPAWAEEFLP